LGEPVVDHQETVVGEVPQIDLRRVMMASRSTHNESSIGAPLGAGDAPQRPWASRSGPLAVWLGMVTALVLPPPS
jgi:hypothetical protein